MSVKADREAAVSRMPEIAGSAESIRKHLKDILESPVFKASRRSQVFLRYVVEKAVAGDLEGLKERIIGVEIFDRRPNYDTSEDAIVRVAAIDVRKRLLRYYQSERAHSEYRISLSSGSYIPEFNRAQTEQPTVTQIGDSPVCEPVMAVAGFEPPRNGGTQMLRRIAWPLLFLTVGIATGVVIGEKAGSRGPKRVLPWPAMFQAGTETHLVFSDASFNMLQEYFRTSISLSDYANRRLLPDLNAPGTEARHTAQMLGGPDFTATTSPVDVAIATRIAELAASYSHPMAVESARQLYLHDFKSDGNFILLGSPRSNPWTGLFQDRLDFSFVFDNEAGVEKIRNLHPKPGESAVYVPTARGGGTGDAYAIAAFTANSDQKGTVLMLSGSTAEATEASAKFVTNLPELAKILRRHGIDPAGPPRHFEALLRVTTMAGSAQKGEVIALHALNK